MRKSAHYGLKLPERDDQYNIDDFDDNFTAIDLTMHNIDSRLVSTSERLDELKDTDREQHEKSTEGILKNMKDIADLKSTFDDYMHTMEKTIADLSKQLGQAQEDIACPIPVKGVYAQFPQQASPEELWPSAKWQLLNYDGAFFRAHGGNAESFIDASGILKKQGESVPNITGTAYLMIHSSYNGTSVGALETITSGASDGNVGDTRGTRGSMQFDASKSNPAYNRRNEVAPSNYTIRIWKRTA